MFIEINKLWWIINLEVCKRMRLVKVCLWSERKDSEDGKSQIYTVERSYVWMLPFVMCEARARNNDHQAGTKSVLKTKLRGLSPRANYTDRAAAAGRWS
jgi:hypothetical protein